MQNSGNEIDTERLHSVYSKMLSILDLSESHSELLSARHLSVAEIRTFGYKTFPTKRSNVVSVVASAFENDLAGIPGFWQNDQGQWQLAGRAGIAIPIRDEKGKICSIKIRVDNPRTPASKYLLLSSNPKVDSKTGIQSHPNGTSAKIRVHYPIPMPDKVKCLRITEGEIKSDITTSILPEYTVSLPGVSNWKLGLEIADKLKPESILLCFDSDKDEAKNASLSTDSSYGGKKSAPSHFQSDEEVGKEEFFVGKCLASLYLALKRAGYEVAIEDWPKELGKGIDDVILDGAGDRLTRLTGEEADDFADKMLLLGIPTGWLYIVGTKRFVHVEQGHELDKEQFSDKFRPENPDVNASMVCLQNPAFVRVDLPIYIPERPVFYTEDRKTFYNFWRTGGIHRAKGDVSIFLEHAEYIVPDKRELGHLLDWLAYNIQQPGKKIHWAMLVQGKQGTGKSYFGRMMSSLLGPNNVSLPTNEMIHEPYTAWQKSCSLVIVEEVMAAERRNLMNKLKPIITEPIVQIREMHKPAYTQPNVFNLLMFTNHEDALVLEEGDRRYCVIFSPAEPKEPSYYHTLWDWTAENLPALLDYMMSRDISKFEAKAHAPMTEAKVKVISSSKPALTTWIDDMIQAEAWPFMGDTICTNHLMAVLPPYLKGVTPQTLGRALAAAGAIGIGQHRVKAGVLRLWAIRRQAFWKLQPTSSVVAEYDRWLMNSTPGGNADYNPLVVSKPL